MRRLLLALLTLPQPGAAQEAPRLTFPVDCTLGETCHLQQFLDRDPGPGARDFRCGPQTYDGHSGTDIRIADRAALAGNWPVLAAAPGIVAGARDGVPDTGLDGALEGQDCGNGVRIDHGGGWETQYCHLAKGSVTVTAGDAVTAGQVLGAIGFSGATEFPHLHFSLSRDGADVDPFDPSDGATCGAGAAPLWAHPVEAAPGGLLSAGFADAVPTLDALRAGTAAAATLDRTGPALVVWGYAHGARAGDVMVLEIRDGRDALFHRHEVTLERDQAEVFRASGRRISEALRPGAYFGTVTLLRNGAVLDRRAAGVTLR
jgi:hypothetical protein